MEDADKMKCSLLLPALLFVATSLAAEADPSAPAASPREIVLFDGKSLDDWEAVDVGGSGIVELAGGLMLINQGEGVSGAVYKKAASLPLTNYEITLEAKRMQGVDFFVGLTFPVGDVKHCATLICGGWGGSVTGISSIDNLDASENNTSSYQRFKDNQWYAVKLSVTPSKIGVWIDGKQIIDEDIQGRKIGVRPGPIESYLPLSLTTFNTTAAIRHVKLTPLVEKK